MACPFARHTLNAPKHTPPLSTRLTRHIPPILTTASCQPTPPGRPPFDLIPLPCGSKGMGGVAVRLAREEEGRADTRSPEGVCFF